MSVYKITITTLSPLHIGDGNELRLGYDFTVFQNRTYRLNVDALLEARGDQLRPDRAGNYPAPSKLLRETDYENMDFFRYSLKGEPRSGKAYASLRSCIKDAYDCAYIPGSSLKGALRTALGWNGWQEAGIQLNRSMIDRKKERAAQPLEREIFGKDPNHDLLRALQVSDCAGSRKPGSRLNVVNAQVLTQHASGSPVELEAISGDAKFTGTLHIDETLFSPLAEPELKFSKRRHWLDDLPQRVQRHSQARLQTLTTWFENAEGASAAASFYRKLLNARLAPNQALLQLGWGTGWDGMTFGTRLQENPQFFEQLVRDFRLSKSGRNTPVFQSKAFPRSKRAVMKIVDGRPAAVAPMGWVLLELEKSGN